MRLRNVPTAAGVIRLLDAVYDVEQSRHEWLTGLLRTLSSTLGPGTGVGGVLYDLSGPEPFRLEEIHGIDLPPQWLEAGIAMHRDERLVPQVVAGYRSLLCATLSELGDRRVKRTYERHRVGDQIMVNGLDCSGKGCALYFFTRQSLTLSAAQRALFSMLATHLATGYRLQRRLAAIETTDSRDAEAVLTPKGRIEHAHADARARRTRQELQQAVLDRERVRAAIADDPRGAVRSMKGLIEARWTLVDRYEREGRRYIVARENEPKPSGPAALSRREQQVVALGALGRSNKLIAYELGIAASTVRVLMARAGAKLQAKTRAAAIALYQTTPKS